MQTKCDCNKSALVILSITLCFFLTVLVLAMAFMVVWVKFDNKQSVYIPAPPIMPMLPVPQQSLIMIDIAGGGEGHHR